jgi:hypothetical protein
MSGTLVFSGRVWYPQADGSPDSTYADITAYDHLIYLSRRQCKTSTGNMITPGDVLTTNVTAPAILGAFIDNTNSFDPNPMPLTVGSVAGGGADVSGVPMSFPMNLDTMRSLLLGTGQLDVFVNPGVGSSTVTLTNGDGGTDLSGSVSYDYGTGAFNCQVATLTVDMDEVTNALWYFLGPRGPRLTDQGFIPENHWGGSITPTAPHVGGTWPPALLARIAASRASYTYMQDIRVFDDNNDEQNIRPLFEEEWANEAWLRAIPRTFASVRPERGITPNFSVGDLITVSAGSQLLGGFSGAQRVYGMEVTCDADGVMSVTDILTSADQEGL